MDELRERDPLEVIRRYDEAWGAGDLDAIAAIVCVDLVGHAGASAFGHADLLKFRLALDNRFGRLSVHTREAVAQDDRVDAMWTTRAITRDTNAAIEWHGISTYRVTGAQIAELWDIRTPNVDKADSQRTSGEETEA